MPLYNYVGFKENEGREGFCQGKNGDSTIQEQRIKDDILNTGNIIYISGHTHYAYCISANDFYQLDESKNVWLVHLPSLGDTSEAYNISVYKDKLIFMLIDSNGKKIGDDFLIEMSINK